jgi:hypothetical protein
MRAVCNGPSFCNLIRAAVLVVVVLPVISTARAEEECEYPSLAGAVLAKPEKQAGEFWITFHPPDYRDAAAVRRHFVFATVWARILNSELAVRSKHQCSAFMTLLRYPDLHAFLIIDPGGVGVDRSICVRTLQDIIVSSRPSAAVVRKNADEEASGGMHWFSHHPTWDQLNVLVTALTHIYRPNTVMHSLYAIGAQSLRSLDANAFRAWLEDQWEAGRRIGVRPVKLCSLEEGPQGMRPRAAKLPYSSLIPPGVVRIPANDIVGSSPTLRHGVVVGHHGLLSGWLFPLVAVTTGKYCGRDLTLPGDGEPGQGFPVTVRISCRNPVAYDNDSWTLFYCEDCPSRQGVEAAMSAIASDPDVIALALSHAVNGQPRGPYLVTIEPDAEQ